MPLFEYQELETPKLSCAVRDPERRHSTNSEANRVLNGSFGVASKTGGPIFNDPPSFLANKSATSPEMNQRNSFKALPTFQQPTRASQRYELGRNSAQMEEGYFSMERLRQDRRGDASYISAIPLVGDDNLIADQDLSNVINALHVNAPAKPVPHTPRAAAPGSPTDGRTGAAVRNKSISISRDVSTNMCFTQKKSLSPAPKIQD